jgi:hypothetical protein
MINKLLRTSDSLENNNPILKKTDRVELQLDSIKVAPFDPDSSSRTRTNIPTNIPIENVEGLKQTINTIYASIGDSSTPPTPEGAPINVVGSDGKLNIVPKHSTWTTPTNYPTALKTVNGLLTVEIGGSGNLIKTTGGVGGVNTIEVGGSGGALFQMTTSTGAFQLTGTGLLMAPLPSTGAGITINYSQLTKFMTIKEIDVCSGGVNKKMLILASDPY